MTKNYPVGKAQQIILDALNLQASSFQEAEQAFKEYGLMVIPIRQGRKSVPEVHLLETTGGGFESEGIEGTAWDIEYKPVRLDKISQWMVK